MKYFAMLATFALVACGADGAPTKPGLKVSANVQVDVTNVPPSTE